MKAPRLIWIFALTLAGGAAGGENGGAPQDRLLVPRDFVRGYIDFQVAPPHNEFDMGLCVTTKGDSNAHTPGCSAYARYMWTGYVELQPVGRGPLRRVFLFAEPRIFAGDNVPQTRYSASAGLILWEHNVGVGIELPKRFELRALSHGVHRLGRYAGPNGALNLKADGPYGQYSTVGVRWYFGNYGRAGRE